MTLADKLKIAREFLNKKQEEMASNVGISHRAWQDYEQGARIPSGKVFKELNTLGFNVSWFFRDDVPMRLNEAPAPPVAAVDEPLLESVIEAVEEYLHGERLTLAPAKKAQLITALYDLFSEEEEKKVNKAVVIRLAKLTA